MGGQANGKADTNKEGDSNRNDAVILGRRLIYSHHIIAKRKRVDLQQLARDYHLTGYVKIGWPGLIVVEGREEDCQQFYDAIRGWSWQYLVVRGEMQESVSALDQARRFVGFQEVPDMSIVANRCREVGLEALFRTSMKVYDNNNDNSSSSGKHKGLEDDDDDKPYGALVHVDHMNNGESHRKWLGKTCQELGVYWFVQQCYPNEDYSKRPTILVGLLGGDDHVGAVLQQWRTRKVDVDSRGRPCLERKMTVLVEGPVGCRIIQDPWQADCSTLQRPQDDRQLNTTQDKLMQLLQAVGGEAWVEAAANLWKK